MANTYHLWFRDKYQLAPTDPRFLAATDEQIEAEFWAYQYQSSRAKEEVEDDDFDLAAVVAGFARSSDAPSMPNSTTSLNPAQPPVSLENISDWEEVDLG